MKRIIFSDVDGTLLNTNHEMTERTKNAILAAGERDIPFVIVSARSPSGIFSIMKEYGFNCPIAAYSGALIMDKDKNILCHKGMEKPIAAQVIDCIESLGLDTAWNIFSVDEWVVKDKNDPRVLLEESVVKTYAKEGDINSVTDNLVNKIMCMCRPDEIGRAENMIKAAFPQLSVMRSSDIMIEVMEKGVTKAAAVEKLCEIWGVPIENTVAFGDNYNDVEMLKAAGKGFLMENAPSELKEKILLHAQSCDDDGVYFKLNELNII